MPMMVDQDVDLGQFDDLHDLFDAGPTTNHPIPSIHLPGLSQRLDALSLDGSSQ